MLRYFVAWNLWVAAALMLVLGQGYARRSPDYYTVFGVGWITPTIFWGTVIAALAIAGFCFAAWRRSSPTVRHTPEPRADRRGFEVIPKATGEATATRPAVER